MLQLTQELGSGNMVIQEVPVPQCSPGTVIVKNFYSIISAGTECSTVTAARKGLIGKARERPEQVRQVFEVLKRQGPIETYRAVSNKLEAYSPLGYSCSGMVIEVGEGVTEFREGDYVACAGAGYANHAEVVSVPVNLCVSLGQSPNFKSAAYNTLGAISMQAVRQCDMRLGESCAVIGLGLLGQIAAVLLKASGVRVIGIDVSKEAVKDAVSNSVVELGLCRNDNCIEKKILEFTRGHGVDAVIIAAATSSLDPINFSGQIARKKGRVVVLGAIPTGFERNPYWYGKELELKMACSYGPGRYDFSYEEKGIDYPLPYVRWTQKRNMEAFQSLMADGKIDIEFLTTHEFAFTDAKLAFDLIVSKKESFKGIALKYDSSKTHSREKVILLQNQSVGKVNISFVGAGSYAQTKLLPNLPKNSNIGRIGILTNTGTTSKRVAEKYGFQFCTSEDADILDEKTNTVFVATRHDSHGANVIKCLNRNKNVFVEKPLCLTKEELEEIIYARSTTKASLMIGFNRRFSPLTLLLRDKIGTGVKTMLYRVNAGAISKDHWIQDKDVGGGRIIGEICHFIDYLTCITGSLPKSILAQAIKDENNLQDTLNILINYSDGSSGIIAYYSNGSSDLPKEYFEVFSDGKSAIISDFRELTIYGLGKPIKKKLVGQNKGQKEMIKCYIESLQNGGPSPISFDEIISSTEASFAILESIKKGGQQIELRF